MPLFEGYIAVDWSAAAVPGQGANSIWIATLLGEGEVQFENPTTRHEAMGYIQMQLDLANAGNQRLLCGFDFPFGYPEGTAQAMTNGNNWAAIWARIAEIIQDDINGVPNANNRFDAAAMLNQCFEGEGPFWDINLPQNAPQGLARRMPHNRWGVNLPPYRRHVERVFPGQSVWQISGPGAVGLQALTGIARLETLRQQRDDVRVWPFQTLGEGRHHVLAEIYPSLINPMPENEVLDQRQVFNVNYFCRCAPIILAGSPPYPASAAEPLRCGSWGRRIPG